MRSGEWGRNEPCIWMAESPAERAPSRWVFRRAVRGDALIIESTAITPSRSGRLSVQRSAALVAVHARGHGNGV